MKRLNELIQQAQRLPKSRLVLASAEEEASLEAALDAHQRGWVDLTLCGDVSAIQAMLSDRGIPLESVRLIAAKSFEESAEESVRQISLGEGDILMKGLLDTSILLKALLAKEAGLRASPLLSHLMLYEISDRERIIGLTDGGMNVAPDTKKRKIILDNAIDAMEKLGYQQLRVAILAAKEKPSASMPATLEAAEIASWYENGPHIVEGPLALDLALSEEAAAIKKFHSRVAGHADLLLVHSIEVGNVLGKAFTYLAHAPSAGVIIGAAVPVLVVSRSDTSQSKLYSIALGKVLAAQERRGH